jgi:hypothetical protein
MPALAAGIARDIRARVVSQADCSCGAASEWFIRVSPARPVTIATSTAELVAPSSEKVNQRSRSAGRHVGLI